MKINFKVCTHIQDLLNFLDWCESSGAHVINIIGTHEGVLDLQNRSTYVPRYEIMYITKTK